MKPKKANIWHGYVTQRNLLKIVSFGLFFIISGVSLSHAAFQESLWGARPAALGGAFTALSDDANAPAYNPAGISLLTKNEMTFMYAQLFSGLNYYAGDTTSRLGLGYLSFVPTIKNKQYGSYAFSWTNFVATNLYREDSFSISVADSYQFDALPTAPILSYGTNLKLLRHSFSTDQRTEQDPVFNSGRSASAYTIDLGLIYQPNFSLLPGLRVGLAGQNITEPNVGLATTDRVPAKYAVGVAYQDERYRLMNPSVDVSRRAGRTLVSAGWESWVAKDVLALRLGGNADEWGGGIGYQFHLFKDMVFRLDYSLLWPLNVNGTNGSHRVSITSNF